MPDNTNRETKGYFFVNALTGEEVLYFPRVFVVKYTQASDRFIVEDSAETLAQYALDGVNNKKVINQGIESGLILEIETKDSDITEFIRLCNQGKTKQARKKAGDIFQIAMYDIDESRTEDNEDDDDDDDED